MSALLKHIVLIFLPFFMLFMMFEIYIFSTSKSCAMRSYLSFQTFAFSSNIATLVYHRFSGLFL